MRNLLVTLALFGTLVLRAQGVISVIPGVPVNGVLTTFVLSPTSPPVGPVAWDFGDGSTLSGGTVATHLYVRTGSYLVRASYVPFAGQLIQTAQLPIRVADRLGPAAPFTISMLRVRWEDGRTDVSVDQGFSPLVAFADLKFEGTGLLQAQWLVDGIPIGTFTEQLAFAGAVTLDSRRAIPLPTTDLGEHLVTLRILAPQVSFQSPQIRYFVRVSGGEEVPRIDTVSPAVVHPGDEAELWITGRRLDAGTAVSFGRDIAVVAPLRFTGPGRAVAKVFVAPTALAGSREVQAFNRSGRSRGPARLQVVPPPPGTSHAGMASIRPTPTLPWSGGVEARPNLLRTLTAFFLLPGGEEGRTIFAPPNP
jgi:hypothetical protein